MTRAWPLASRGPYVQLRVQGARWSYLLDKAGEFPRPARFDTLFVRCVHCAPAINLLHLG
jgi:hypothetical protein